MLYLMTMRSMLTENLVGWVFVNLKTLSPRNEKRSLSSEVINRSCSPRENDTLLFCKLVKTSTNPLICVFCENKPEVLPINTSSVQIFDIDFSLGMDKGYDR